MKKVVRYISLISLCVMIIFALTACGGNKDEAKLENAKQSLEQSMMSFAVELENFRGLSDAEISAYNSSLEKYVKSNALTEEQAKMNEEVISEWHKIEGDLGAFKGFGDFEFDSAGKTYTATLTVNYEKRDTHLVYVISKKDFEVTGANVEIVYTFGEKMQKAGMNTLMGICIVFVMLVLMSLVICAFNLIPYFREKYSKRKEEKRIDISKLEGDDDDVGVAEEVTDNKELIAVIAAAIATSTGRPTDGFVVRSVRRRR